MNTYREIPLNMDPHTEGPPRSVANRKESKVIPHGIHRGSLGDHQGIFEDAKVTP